jgi:hypothetical protein
VSPDGPPDGGVLTIAPAGPTATGTDADEASRGDTVAGTAGTAMAEDTACADELPRLHVVNGTGNAVEEIIMLACDMSDEVSFPVPSGGLPDCGELTIDLPGPGCWVLQYNGEGCFADPPGHGGGGGMRDGGVDADAGESRLRGRVTAGTLVAHLLFWAGNGNGRARPCSVEEAR